VERRGKSAKVLTHSKQSQQRKRRQSGQRL
jgi:hypothetical protein